MANICNYDMMIRGDEANMRQLVQMLERKHPAGYFIGRIDDAYVMEEDEDFKIITGGCAWSVEGSMMDASYRPHRDKMILQDASKYLNLDIEVYGEEIGYEFAEHYIIENGNITTAETTHYAEYCKDDFDNVEALNEEYGTHFTKEEFERCDGSYLIEGGFPTDDGCRIWNI